MNTISGMNIHSFITGSTAIFPKASTFFIFPYYFREGFKVAF